MTERSIPELSIDSKLIYDRLLQVGVGEVVTYAELSGLIKRDIRNGAYGCLTTARRRAEKLNQCVFGVVRNEGLRRLSDNEIVESGVDVLDKTRRAARRGFHRLTCVDFDKLPEEVRVKHQTYGSIMSALVTVTKPGAVKKVEEQVVETRQQLPLASTLKAFTK